MGYLKRDDLLYYWHSGYIYVLVGWLDQNIWLLTYMQLIFNPQHIMYMCNMFVLIMSFL